MRPKYSQCISCIWRLNEECFKPKGEICPATCTKSTYKKKEEKK